MNIFHVSSENCEEIARLAVCLTNEIMERTGVAHFNVDLPATVNRCRQFIEQGHYCVVAARDGDRIVGFGTLCESHSLYAEGSFGIIQEFFVLPEFRSRQVGKQLLEHIINLAREREWKRLELCTPPMPAFARTLEFYQHYGFEITGGYKMKRLIT